MGFEQKEYITIQNIEHGFQELQRKKDLPAYNPKKHEDHTRAWVTGLFILGYFFLLILAEIFVYIYNYHILSLIKEGVKLETNLLFDIKNVLFVLTSALGTPLGFIIGYYFKENKN